MKLNKIKANMVDLKDGLKFDLDRALSNAIQGINDGNIRSFTVDASLNNPLVKLSSTLEDGTVNTYHILAELDYLTKPKVVSTESGSFIKRTELENTGGGCMVDVITLDNDMVVTISEDCLVVHPNLTSWHDQRPEQNCIDFESVKEAEDKRIQVAQAEVSSNMAKLLENWCNSQNLMHFPAGEISKHNDLTSDQYAWLNHYISMHSLA